MIRPFDFVFDLQRSEKKRKVIYSMMEQVDDVEYAKLLMARWVELNGTKDPF